MLHRQPWLRELHWRRLILDEAQAIKNAQTRQSKAVKALPAQARIVLTGTPVENHLGDLWSLFDFLNPGLLGSASVFKRFVKRLQSAEPASYAPLRQLVAPYILRRMKTDRSIIADLPPKTETQAYCTLSRAQVRLYQQTVESTARALQNADGMARRGLVLQTLMRLKQICKHPSQLTGEPDYAAADSGKFLRLAELCEELAERQQRVLVFTQFREIIEPLMQHLASVFGRAGAHVMGSDDYRVRVNIAALKPAAWKALKQRCAGGIGSLLELLQGRLSEQVMGIVNDRDSGLFPKSGEMKFSCNCPDWATMCKHVAATLYGVGNRLDAQPELLFRLRGIDPAKLIEAGTVAPLTRGPASRDDLAEHQLGAIFGIELDADVEAAPTVSNAPKSPRKAASKRKTNPPSATVGPVRPASAPAGNRSATCAKNSACRSHPPVCSAGSPPAPRS